MARHRIVYVGDNLTDVDAGLVNGVHFIDFATDPRRQERLLSAGAPLVAGNHRQTLQYIRNHLGLSNHPEACLLTGWPAVSNP